jgi:hypothetical protein
MDINQLLEILVTLLPIIGLGVFFFFYYKSEKVRSATKAVLKFAPFLLSLLASRVKDTKGVFDKHDALVLLGRLAEHVRETIADPTNVSFDDVQDDLFDFVRKELDTYRAAGVKGVPDVTDESIRVQIRVIFLAAQRMADENSTGDDSSG